MSNKPVNSKTYKKIGTIFILTLTGWEYNITYPIIYALCLV